MDKDVPRIRRQVSPTERVRGLSGEWGQMGGQTRTAGGGPKKKGRGGPKKQEAGGWAKKEGVALEQNFERSS